MNVTIHLARGSGSREVIQVLRAVEAAKRTRRSHLNLFDLLHTGVYRLVALAFSRLEIAVQPLVDRVCRLAEHLQKQWQTLKVVRAA